MSVINSANVQVGQSVTATHNFTLKTNGDGVTDDTAAILDALAVLRIITTTPISEK